MSSPQARAHRLLLRRLIAARDASGLTQEQLAERLKRDQSFVSRYEKGRGLDIVEFVEICGIVGARPEKLIRRLPVRGGPLPKRSRRWA